ncbi:hypothetical protein TNCV_4714491 [Trichonephila clavipes]|nr:hypothetical protein TNCV_4714491 [Trichonephila clavipes]
MLSSRPGAIYQQDNARPHTARLSQQSLQGYDVYHGDLPQEVISDLIESMPRRISACIAARGGFTTY